jgi:tRNA C32,U32 (ribose-2'-O)-methylase TrmJ
MALENQNPVKGQWEAMSQDEISALVSSITDTLENIGFYKYPGKEMQARFLHDVISRAGLAGREGQYLKDIFVKAAKLGSMIDKTML